MLRPLRFPSMGHPYVYRFLHFYISVKGCLEPGEFFPVFHLKLDSPKILDWLIYCIFFNQGFLIPGPINSDSWSYVIFVGQGYLVNHVNSTKLLVFIAHVLLYFSILSQTVTRLSIVTYLRNKFSFLPFLCMAQGYIIYTLTLIHVMY